jgi:FAD/FMN-containing dehydrogenase
VLGRSAVDGRYRHRRARGRLAEDDVLDAELGAARVLHRAVKHAFDPAGLMNRGKAI